MGVVAAMTNEEFVELIRAGSEVAVEELLQNNREYLYKLARRLSRNPDTMEDLAQEGRIAILEATSSFDPAKGVLFLTYATPFIRKAVRDFMARMSLPMTVPAARYSQLRRVNYLVAKFQMDKDERPLQGLLQLICQEMKVSEKVARGLLWDFSTFFHEIALDEQWEQSISCFYAGLAKVYEQELLVKCIWVATEELSPRKRNLIQYHLGLSVPEGIGTTFQKLAVLLNFNEPSAAVKAYLRAVKSLRQTLYAGRYGKYMQTKQAIQAPSTKHGEIIDIFTGTWYNLANPLRNLHLAFNSTISLKQSINSMEK